MSPEATSTATPAVSPLRPNFFPSALSFSTIGSERLTHGAGSAVRPGEYAPLNPKMHEFTAWMENTLDTRAKGPRAGYVQIQRLNRTEYTTSVKALVGVELKAADVLPQDGQLDSFDNIAAVLTVSPAFLSQYITAARQVAKLAIGSPNPRVSNVKYSINANQNPDVPLPLGTRGGVKFKHNFPADGEYRITMNDLGVGLYTGPVENESTLVIMIDGKIVFRKPIGGPADCLGSRIF